MANPSPMPCQIAVRVTPRSAKPGIGGWRAGADGREELEIRVAAAPADGAANESVVRLLAEALQVPRSSVTIASGHSSRHKRIRVELDAGELRDRLARPA